MVVENRPKDPVGSVRFLPLFKFYIGIRRDSRGCELRQVDAQCSMLNAAAAPSFFIVLALTVLIEEFYSYRMTVTVSARTTKFPLFVRRLYLSLFFVQKSPLLSISVFLFVVFQYRFVIVI